MTEIHSTSGWQEQETVLQVRRWHSPTGSYIHAPPISNLPECATDLRLNVSYIWSHKRPQNVTLYTQVCCSFVVFYGNNDAAEETLTLQLTA